MESFTNASPWNARKAPGLLIRLLTLSSAPIRQPRRTPSIRCMLTGLPGQLMEIDARNGVIVRLGRKHRIATPLNQMIVDLLHAAQG